MNVGLPGTGIGGLFYLLSALCMPLSEAARRIGGQVPGSWRAVIRQTLLAVGIAGGIWVTGWFLAEILAGSPLIAAALRGAGAHGMAASNVLRMATLAISLGTLAIVIAGVWVAKLAVHGWGSPAAGAQRPLRLIRARKRRVTRKNEEYDAA